MEDLNFKNVFAEVRKRYGEDTTCPLFIDVGEEIPRGIVFTFNKERKLNKAVMISLDEAKLLEEVDVSSSGIIIPTLEYNDEQFSYILKRISRGLASSRKMQESEEDMMDPLRKTYTRFLFERVIKLSAEEISDFFLFVVSLSRSMVDVDVLLQRFNDILGIRIEIGEFAAKADDYGKKAVDAIMAKLNSAPAPVEDEIVETVKATKPTENYQHNKQPQKQQSEQNRPKDTERNIPAPSQKQEKKEAPKSMAKKMVINKDDVVDIECIKGINPYNLGAKFSKGIGVTRKICFQNTEYSIECAMAETAALFEAGLLTECALYLEKTGNSPVAYYCVENKIEDDGNSFYFVGTKDIGVFDTQVFDATEVIKFNVKTFLSNMNLKAQRADVEQWLKEYDNWKKLPMQFMTNRTLIEHYTNHAETDLVLHQDDLKWLATLPPMEAELDKPKKPAQTETPKTEPKQETKTEPKPESKPTPVEETITVEEVKESVKTEEVPYNETAPVEETVAEPVVETPPEPVTPQFLIDHEEEIKANEPLIRDIFTKLDEAIDVLEKSEKTELKSLINKYKKYREERIAGEYNSDYMTISSNYKSPEYNAIYAATRAVKVFERDRKPLETDFACMYCGKKHKVDVSLLLPGEDHIKITCPGCGKRVDCYV